jgi:hypothetical protein
MVFYSMQNKRNLIPPSPSNPLPHPRSSLHHRKSDPRLLSCLSTIQSRFRSQKEHLLNRHLYISLWCSSSFQKPTLTPSPGRLLSPNPSRLHRNRHRVLHRTPAPRIKPLDLQMRNRHNLLRRSGQARQTRHHDAWPGRLR